jgi:hypothetical protein
VTRAALPTTSHLPVNRDPRVHDGRVSAAAFGARQLPGSTPHVAAHRAILRCITSAASRWSGADTCAYKSSVTRVLE